VKDGVEENSVVRDGAANEVGAAESSAAKAGAARDGAAIEAGVDMGMVVQAMDTADQAGVHTDMVDGAIEAGADTDMADQTGGDMDMTLDMADQTGGDMDMTLDMALRTGVVMAVTTGGDMAMGDQTGVETMASAIIPSSSLIRILLGFPLMDLHTRTTLVVLTTMVPTMGPLQAITDPALKTTDPARTTTTQLPTATARPFLDSLRTLSPTATRWMLKLINCQRSAKTSARRQTTNLSFVEQTRVSLRLIRRFNALVLMIGNKGRFGGLF